jgi:hypothetical protein
MPKSSIPTKRTRITRASYTSRQRASLKNTLTQIICDEITDMSVAFPNRYCDSTIGAVFSASNGETALIEYPAGLGRHMAATTIQLLRGAPWRFCPNEHLTEHVEVEGEPWLAIHWKRKRSR